MEWGRGRRRRFNSKGELPLTSLSRNWLPPQSEHGDTRLSGKKVDRQSISRSLKRRLNSRENSFGMNDLSNNDTLACNPPLTLPISKSLIKEQIGILEFAKTLAGFSLQHLTLQEKDIDSLPLAHLLSPPAWQR